MQSWPLIATKQASVLASDWVIFTMAGLAVFLLLVVLIVFPLVRWRARAGQAEPPQFKNNPPLEITWTVIPIVLVMGLFVYSFQAEARVDATAIHPAVTVHVNAYRWGWTFRYEGGPSIGGATTGPILGTPFAKPPELVLPLGETTHIELTSSDVDHSFWVPDFLFKRDAIPGQMSSFDLQPDKLGSFVGRCAQFCGLDHALMTFTVRVVSPDDYTRWLKGAKNS